MQIIRQAEEMQRATRALRREGKRIGLVPTMGFLHEGHLSLVDALDGRAEVIVLSIFVNPTQFGPDEDLDAYPVDLERDEALCRERGVDIIYQPPAADMYAGDASTFIDETLLTRHLCGPSRPGHFRGVITVVAKLFNLVQPDIAVFGDKDGQQLRVIQRMVRDLNFPVEVIGAPTVREADGLAMSSRNAYLAADEREQAVCLRRALDLAEALHADGVRKTATIKEAMKEPIAAASKASIDYLEIVDDESLQPVDRIEGPVLVALAVKIGKARLIDNTVLR